MAKWQPGLQRRKGRGSYPRIAIDDDSVVLLSLYAERRRSCFAAPRENSLRTEIDALKSLRFECIARGGPSTLRQICDEPEIVVQVLRESQHGKSFRQAMRRAVNRLIDVIHDEERAMRLKFAIREGLPPIRKGGAWNRVERGVPGSNAVARRRPALSSANLLRFIEAAGRTATDDPARDAGLAALHCLWGGLEKELVAIKVSDVFFFGADERVLWCAAIVVRRDERRLDIPVAAEAYVYLREIWERAYRGKSSYLFRSPEDRTQPVSRSTVQRVFRRAAQAACLPVSDSVTFRRAYANYLRLLGLNDFEIRDAFGTLTMSAVDSRLRQHRWLDAQHRLGLHRPRIEREDALRGDTA